ncbi:hypothetical protein SO802_005969 [Lithocarpus litseifolius]|uniref:RNase H type-1 domain-containing protein n=1 Tax=Lithocarpus litseifolius TaxID=425828 RepID=A0AAW2DPB9_9ROSI
MEFTILGRIQECECLSELSSMVQVVGWSPPLLTRYKIDMDGAVCKTQKSVGVGVLIRDEHGQVVEALSKKINGHLGTLEVVAKEVEAGLHFARDIGINDLIIEGDSLVVYNALCGHSSPSSFMASVILGFGAMVIEIWHLERR